MANNIPSGSKIGPARLANGWIAETNPTTATTANTTETMHATVTATLATGRRYKIGYRGPLQSSIAGDRIELRFRIASGASVTTSSTQLRIVVQDADVAARNNQITFEHVLTVALNGQWTIGISLKRTTGTGTGKLDALAGLAEPIMLLEDIGGS